MSEEKEKTSLGSLEDFQDSQEKPEIVVSDNQEERVVQQNLVNIVALFEKQDWLESKNLVEMERLNPERAGEIIQAKILDRKQTLELVRLSLEHEKYELEKYYSHVENTEIYQARQNLLATVVAGLAFFGILSLCGYCLYAKSPWIALAIFVFSLTAIAYLSGREQPKYQELLGHLKELKGLPKKNDQ